MWKRRRHRKFAGDGLVLGRVAPSVRLGQSQWLGAGCKEDHLRGNQKTLFMSLDSAGRKGYQQGNRSVEGKEKKESK